jgi:hypothetical protein
VGQPIGLKKIVCGDDVLPTGRSTALPLSPCPIDLVAYL